VNAIPYHAVRAEMGLSHEGGYVTPLDLKKVMELRPPPPPKPKPSASAVEAAASTPDVAEAI